MFTYHIVSSEDDSYRKVAEVLVSFEGAKGPSEETRRYFWYGLERFKVDGSGKHCPKTGADYKAEIEALVFEAYFPKG